MITLVLAALTTVLLIAPVAAHRMVFRRGRKPELVDVAHRFALAGLATLGLSVVGAVMLALDVTIGRVPAARDLGAARPDRFVLWFLMPLPLRREPTADAERR